VAQSGICSRREADELIAAGLVSINGVIVTELGTKVKVGDEERFNGEKIQGEKYGNLPTYDVIDAILYRMLERWQDREEIIDAGFEESDVDAVRAMIYASLEMFNQFCPIVAVSPMPLDRSYVDLPKSTKSVF
jgi:hypothetical protein